MFGTVYTLLDYLFSEKAQRPLSNDYTISSDISRYSVSHKFIHWVASTIPKKIPQKISPQKILILPSFSSLFQISCHLFPPFLSCSIYISYQHTKHWCTLLQCIGFVYKIVYVYIAKIYIAAYMSLGLG